MALQFHPYPFPQEEESDVSRDFVNPLIQSVGLIQQNRQAANTQKMQQFQMEMLKAKEAREAAEHMYQYGDPTAPDLTTAGGFAQADPRLSLYQPATMPGESQYGNITAAMRPEMAPRDPMAPSLGRMGAGDTSGGMVERFRAWQQSRKAGAPGASGPMTEEQLYAPGFGAKRREDYRKGQEFSLKTRETEADIKKKEAEAKWWSERQPQAAGGLMITPGASAAIANGDWDALAREYPGGIPLSVQNAFQTAKASNTTAENTKIKRENEDKALQVNGWTLKAGTRPDDIEVRKAKDAQAQFDSFRNSVNTLKKLVAKYGTVELTGAESGQMSSLVKDLQLTLKNIAQLGVLSASDIPFLTEQIPDINTAKAAGMTRATYAATLDQTLRTAENKLNAFMSSRGYSRAGASVTGGGGQPGKIKVSNGKEALWIDPSDASDAARDGYQSVS